MFQKQNDGSRSKMESLLRKHPPTIIAADLHLLGNIISEGVLDVDGRIEGNIKCKCVTIRKNGSVKGDILADEVHIFGAVVGLVKAKDVHFFSTCHVEGVIMHESLTIEDGAFVDGQFKRMDRSAAEEEETDEDSDVFRSLKLISCP